MALPAPYVNGILNVPNHLFHNQIFPRLELNPDTTLNNIDRLYNKIEDLLKDIINVLFKNTISKGSDVYLGAPNHAIINRLP
jgi:hypothetical protein